MIIITSFMIIIIIIIIIIMIKLGGKLNLGFSLAPGRHQFAILHLVHLHSPNFINIIIIITILLHISITIIIIVIINNLSFKCKIS